MRTTIVLVFALLSACATGHPEMAYIKSTTDQKYAPQKSDPIHVVLSDKQSIDDRNVSRLVEREMHEAGFHVVGSRDSAKYLLVVGSKDNVSQIKSVRYVPQTQTTKGTIGDTPYSSTTTTRVATPYSYSYATQHLFMALYLPSSDRTTMTNVWQGVVGASAETFQKRQRDVINLLLDVFGHDYDARTPIRPVVRTQLPLSPPPSPTVASPVLLGQDTLPPDSSYFTVIRTRISRFVRTFEGREITGHIRTTKVNTNVFDGYVQFENTGFGETGSHVLSFGGAYSVKADGVYVTSDVLVPALFPQDADASSITGRGLQKVISFPIRVGDRRAIRLPVMPDTEIAYSVERIEPETEVPAGTFRGCVIIRVDSAVDSISEWTRSWFCPNVGWVMDAGSNGAVSKLVGYSVQ